MSQTDMDAANGPGASFRADLNLHFHAIATNNSGPFEPSPSFENQWWADTDTNILKRRNSTNSAWIEVMDLYTGLLIASQAEARAGTNNVNRMTPLRTAEAIVALSPRLTGEVIMFSASTAPAGWLNCDGAEISRTTFSDLFAVIGTTYGTGNDPTTFYLPDARGRSPLGEGTGSGLTARALGEELGEEDHQLTEDELASHTHSIEEHDHPTRGDGNDTSTSHGIATISTGATGGDVAHNTMQPSLVFNFIIKT